MATKTTTEKVVINSSNFDGILQLLISSNQEDKVVGLQSIENCDFKNSIGPILLLHKKSELGASLWKENAPNTLKKVEGLGIKGDDNPTWNKIITILGKNGYPIEQVAFMFDEFAIKVKDNLLEWGYDFIEKVDIKITLKEDEKQK